jgi:drug/metabolite transporter (DMT)-like permease
MKQSKSFAGFASLLSATFIYGFFGVLARVIGLNLPLFYQSWVRNLFQLFILAVFVLLLRKWVPVKQKDVKWLLLRTFGGLVGFFGSFIAFLYIPFGTTYFVFYAGSTIGGYLLGNILFHEKFTLKKIISLGLSVVGLLFIYSVSFEMDKSIYVLAALLSGFGTSVWNTFSKKISDVYSALQLNFIDTILTFAVTLSISLIIREQWVAPELSPIWLAMILFAVMFILTGQLMVYGFSRLDVHLASLIMLTEILFGVIFGYVFFRESVTPMTLVGGLLIISAIVLPELKVRKQKHVKTLR